MLMEVEWRWSGSGVEVEEEVLNLGTLLLIITNENPLRHL
jgi:hypothetical protein